MKTPLIRITGSLALSLSVCAAAWAADFPTRPVTLVSPYQAGGSADGIARAIAEVAGRNLGQPVVVEAKPGAEGLIGALDVAKAPADGYRLLWGGAGSMMIVPALRKTPPFDPATAFTAIAGTVDFSFFLFVHPDIEVDSAKAFMDYARANPGKIDYATGNNQGLLSFAYVAQQEKIDAQRVQYKGETGAITDLLTGRVQAMFGTSTAIPYARDKRLNVLATTLNNRSPLLPDVPTMKEAGVTEVPFGGGWLGIFGPPGVPKDVVQRLNKAFMDAFNDPSVKQRMELAGLVHTPRTIAELEQYVKDERDLYHKVVRDLGLPLVD